MAGDSEGDQLPLLNLSRRERSYAYRVARNDWLPDLVRQARFDLPGSVHAGFEARRAIAEQFDELLSRQEQEILGLLASELINNSVLHGGADTEHHVILHIAIASECIRAEVCDGGPGLDPAELRERGHNPGGMGFVILDGLANRWGVATDDGTCVWFELDRPLAAAAG